MTAESFSTSLLERSRHGESVATEELFGLLYDELRSVAARCLQRERLEHTLQPTALVHEAWLRLAGDADIDWQGRGHFLAISAKVIRRILIEHARGRAAEKRGGDRQRVTLHDVAPGDDAEVDVLDLDGAMERLAEKSPRQAQVVELHYFGGLGTAEIADQLAVTDRTVRGDLTFARTWLSRELGRA